jgi:hypothetical protein
MKYLMVGLVVALSGCATNFVGSAYVEEGRAGCERKCQGDGLVMSGIVYMGEYSSACVCEVPSASGASGANASNAASGATGAAAGVVMQMRRNQDQQNKYN